MNLLRELVETPGVAGREGRVRDCIAAYISEVFDEVRTDRLGSLVAVRHPRPQTSSDGEPMHVLIDAHIDQIGFLVRHIDAAGLLTVQPVGFFDYRCLFDRRVLVCTREGELPGVMNPLVRPRHISQDSERKQVPGIEQFRIDLGLSADVVRQRVRIGDPVVCHGVFQAMGDCLVGPALDNRLACWVAIRAVENLKFHRCRITCVFAVQEEVGMRGAGPAAWNCRPDAAICLEAVYAGDAPGLAENEHCTRLGEGAAIMIADGSVISDETLVDQLEAVAQRRQIPVQRCVVPDAGQDAAMIQQSCGGVPVVALACPARYMHTTSETIHRRDLEAMRDLLTAWLESVG